MHKPQAGPHQCVESSLEGFVAYSGTAKGDATDVCHWILQRCPCSTYIATILAICVQKSDTVGSWCLASQTLSCNIQCSKCLHLGAAAYPRSTYTVARFASVKHTHLSSAWDADCTPLPNAVDADCTPLPIAVDADCTPVPNAVDADCTTVPNAAKASPKMCPQQRALESMQKALSHTLKTRASLNLLCVSAVC